MKLLDIYRKLLSHFGEQNWWPMIRGFDPPEWEVCIGAVLTQNTNWGNVEKALENLRKAGMAAVIDIAEAKRQQLEKLIKPSGFYKQKAERLKLFSDFVLGFGGFRGFSRKVKRDMLLKVKGIGPETADSVLLYACNRPVFVIDAYTKRVFSRVGGIKGLENLTGYEDWRRFFESRLPKDANLYREFHALIVELAKQYCKTKPVCEKCPLNKNCRKHL